MREEKTAGQKSARGQTGGPERGYSSVVLGEDSLPGKPELHHTLPDLRYLRVCAR